MNRVSVKLAHLLAIAGVLCVVAAGPAQADWDDRHEGHHHGHHRYYRERYYAPQPEVYYAPRTELYYAPPVYVPPPPSWGLNLVFPFHRH
jgi:hypothetical protein